MPRCTAPVNGHRTASAAAACPACGSRYSGRNSYSSNSNYYSLSYSYGSGSPTRNISSIRNSKPSWSRSSSPMYYTKAEIQALSPIRRTIENLSTHSDLRDVFLCHAWDDRNEIAKELYNLLVSNGVTVWFSEKEIRLGVPLMRAIDKGLANSRIGLVLVTPALLMRLPQEGIADKELSALLARDQLVPIVHNTTYESLREVSPLLASRTGLSTNEESMLNVATKIAELVALEANSGNI
jgi:hypothetical protein